MKIIPFNKIRKLQFLKPENYSKVRLLRYIFISTGSYHIHANQCAISANVAINNIKTAAPYSE